MGLYHAILLLTLLHTPNKSFTKTEESKKLQGKRILTYDGARSTQHNRGKDKDGIEMRTFRAINVHQIILLQVREDDYLFNYTGEHEEERDYREEVHDTEDEGMISEDNCTHPRQHPRYNDSCDFVHAECGEKSEMIDYLAFVLCDLPKAQFLPLIFANGVLFLNIHCTTVLMQPIGYILMGMWLIYLISLLATTVDIFFVPTLNYISEKLSLSPSVAGVTFMALGNGAPGIFVVYSGIAQDDLALVLGYLTGAATFISSVVLGTVMLVSKVWPYNLDKIDFMRNIIALIVVVGTVIGVAFDGRVYLIEACIFPLIYVLYIIGVVSLSYYRTWIAKQTDTPSLLHHSSLRESCKVTLGEDSNKVTQKDHMHKNSLRTSLNLRDVSRSYRSVFSMTSTTLEEKMPLTKSRKESSTSTILSISMRCYEKENGQHLGNYYIKGKVEEDHSEEEEEEAIKEVVKAEERMIFYLNGLSWPKGSFFMIKIIWLIQWPFSLLRWFTIPSFYHAIIISRMEVEITGYQIYEVQAVYKSI